MKYKLLFFTNIFLMIFCGCLEKNDKKNNEPINLAMPHIKNSLSNYRIFENSDFSYGYDIIVNGTLYIHQPFIPAVQGRQGFKTKTEANSLALLVILKINNHQPLIINLKELDSLKIFFKKP